MSQMGGFPKTQNEPQGLWRLGLGAAGGRPRTRELPGGPRPLRWKPLASGVKRKRVGQRAGGVTRTSEEMSAGERRT